MIVQIEAYQYAELSEEAKERVRDSLNEYAPDLWEDDKEYWLGELAALGYEDVDFAYSGFYCQGDGASIACRVNVQQFIKRHKAGREYRSLLYWTRKVFGDGGAIRVRRERWGHYVHEYLLRADGDDLLHDLWCYDAPERLETDIESLAASVLDEVREWSRKIYKSLEEQHLDHYSDEYAEDMCEANEYLFDRRGNPVHSLVVAA